MQKRSQLPRDAERDRLTGLAGPGMARTMLTRWQVDGVHSGAAMPVHAILLGLGRFDTVNLAFGEAAGDGALIEVARRIMHFAEDEFEGEDWCAARLAGGQFLLIARDGSPQERWQWLAEALADAVAHPIGDVTGGASVRLWPRVALLRAMPGETADGIIERLAATLESTRGKQGRRIAWASGATPASGPTSGMRASQLEAHLLNAIDREEIAIRYQPLVSLKDGRILGAEALARWHHSKLGRIGASALFTIAERADHIAPLSRHIARRALRDAKGWGSDLRLSLNITPTDLSAASFANEFCALLDDVGFPAERLTLEITEQVLLADLDLARRSLGRLKERGIAIALDDFGGGFCNFRYLKMLPLDYLKLDRTMVDGIAHDEQDLAVFRAINAMAGALGLDVIVEGIEDEAQRAIAAAEGCAMYQGFLKAPPLKVRDLLAMVRDERLSA